MSSTPSTGGSRRDPGREAAAAARQARAQPPNQRRPPLQALALRGLLAVGLLLVVAVTVLLGGDGFVDETGGDVGVVDALYYASVTTTTTGYGDITPVTTGTRLATLLVITPARVGFLLLLVGTTVELLTERWREAHRRDRWRRRVDEHYIITGYGVKGRSAARALCEDGVSQEAIVIVELRRDAADEASAEGYTVIVGDASRAQVLREARIERARAVIIAPSRDDTAVLTTLTARELAPRATIIASVREEENAHLLRQSGADEAIVSAETSGRLLGLTSRNPRVGQIVSDLLHTDYGLALVEHEVSQGEAGSGIADLPGQRTIAVVRDGRMLRYDDPEIGDLQEGDRVVGFPNGDDGAHGGRADGTKD